MRLRPLFITPYLYRNIYICLGAQSWQEQEATKMLNLAHPVQLFGKMKLVTTVWLTENLEKSFYHCKFIS